MSYPLDSLVSAECDDGVMCCSAIDDAGGHTQLLVWGLRRPPARATCPAPCQGERYTAASASTAPSTTTTHKHITIHTFTVNYALTTGTEGALHTHCETIWNKR